MSDTNYGPAWDAETVILENVSQIDSIRTIRVSQSGGMNRSLPLYSGVRVCPQSWESPRGDPRCAVTRGLRQGIEGRTLISPPGSTGGKIPNGRTGGV